MAMRILIARKQLESAIAVKGALEQRHLQIYPFTRIETALDFLSDNPVDYAVIDMDLSGYDASELIKKVKQVRADIRVIASTSSSAVATAAISAGAIGLIDSDYKARTLLRLLKQLTTKNPSSTESPDDENEAENLDSVSLFERLSAEEPPMPDLQVGGTITTYMSRVTDNELNTLLDSINEILDADEASGDKLVYDIEIIDNPAYLIAGDAADDTIPLEDEPFEAYLDRIRDRSDTGRILRESPFVEGDKSYDIEVNQIEDESQEGIDSDLEDTPASELKRIQNQHDGISKEDFQVIEPSHFPKPSTLPLEDNLGHGLVDSRQRREPLKDKQLGEDDARIAQMAISLTQASLEATAVATMLIRDKKLIAHEGSLSNDQVTEIADLIVDHDHQTATARVRFVLLGDDDRDYLVFSKMMSDKSLLSMVFEGNTSITEIRHQAILLTTALESIPSLSSEETAKSIPSLIEPDRHPQLGIREDANPDADMKRMQYTFVWSLHEHQKVFDQVAKETIYAGLQIQLAERGWYLSSLELREEYGYLMALIPSEQSPRSVIRDLQDQAAIISAKQNSLLNTSSLWADSYFIMLSEREPNSQEIQQYLDFSQM